MKKFLTTLFCAVIAALSAFGFSACADNGRTLTCYAPDGAPALALSKLLADDKEGGQTEYHVVDASLIQTFVTGENPAADLCIMPVNLAAKLLGKATSYKMLGTVTHGNLYLLKKAGGADINGENLSSLVGKTVGVINLAAVPGLTFELILKGYGLDFNILGAEAKADDKVNLKAVSATEVTPAAECDYFVVPEPAASVKVKATTLEYAGSLQELYGEGKGYPQAVAVAKNSVIENNLKQVKSFIAALKENAEWLSSDEIGDNIPAITSAIAAHVESGYSPTLTDKNLTAAAIKNCAVKFVGSAECKDEVNAFLKKLVALNSAAAAEVDDGFYYA